jgi:hypothetical protein
MLAMSLFSGLKTITCGRYLNLQVLQELRNARSCVYNSCHYTVRTHMAVSRPAARVIEHQHK